jgi:Skp family chaperone for outer membrane proteins
MQGLRALALALAAGGLGAGAVSAQVPEGPFPLGEGQLPLGMATPILTLDQERLFEDSAFGRRVVAELEAASRALSAENRRLEEELAAEERALTERRPDLPPDEFRALADEFDSRVEQIRRTQEDKSLALAQYRYAEGQRFFELAVPILMQIVIESGAVAVLDNRAIFLAAEQIDMTDLAIARIDAAIGSGAEEAPDAPPAESAPEAEPPATVSPEGGPPLELPDPVAPE